MAPAPHQYIDARARANPPTVTYRNPQTAAVRKALGPYHSSTTQLFRAIQMRARPTQPWYALHPADRRIVNRRTGEPVPDDELPPEDDGDAVAHPAPRRSPSPARPSGPWGAPATEPSGWGDGPWTYWSEPVGPLSASGWPLEDVTPQWMLRGGDDSAAPSAPNPAASAQTANAAPVSPASPLPAQEAVAADTVVAVAADTDVAVEGDPAEDADEEDAAEEEEEEVEEEDDWKEEPRDCPPRTTRIPTSTQRYESRWEMRDRLKEEYLLAQAICAKKNEDCRPHMPCDKCFKRHRGAKFCLAGETFIDVYVDDEDTDSGSVNGIPEASMYLSTTANDYSRDRVRDADDWYARQENEVHERFPMW